LEGAKVFVLFPDELDELVIRLLDEDVFEGGGLADILAEPVDVLLGFTETLTSADDVVVLEGTSVVVCVIDIRELRVTRGDLDEDDDPDDDLEILADKVFVPLAVPVFDAGPDSEFVEDPVDVLDEDIDGVEVFVLVVVFVINPEPVIVLDVRPLAVK
jgi:hypothetical protein